MQLGAFARMDITAIPPRDRLPVDLSEYNATHVIKYRNYMDFGSPSLRLCRSGLTSVLFPTMTPRFRTEFAKIEARRAALLARLDKLPEPARQHPAYKNVRELVGPKFISSALAKRAAVL